MKTITRFFVNLIILLLILWLPLKGITIAHAQTAQPPPQKVIATGQYINSGCPDSPLDIRLEVWNIGSTGGKQYSTATMTITGYSCVNGKTSGGLGTDYFGGTFSGGPDGDGNVTLEGGTSDQQSLQFSFHFAGGKSVVFQTFTLKVENPEAFYAVATQAQEASPTPAPESTGQVIATPTPESTEAVGSIPTPVPTGAVGSNPTQAPANDCLKDPLNAAGCMSTPFVRQGVAAVISVGAALATILVSMLGSNATAAGAAAGAVAGGAVGEAAAGADTGATTGEAATGTNANIAAGAATATGGAPAGTVTGAATGQTASPEQGNPTSGTMRQAEYRQLQAHLEDLKTLAHTLARDELEWRTEWRRLFDLHQKGITNYQSNAAKVIFSFGKNVLDWTPISPTGPGKIVNTAVEKISSTVTDIITTPPSKGATDAQILEHMRKINKALEEKMEEAKKKTYEIHNELETVQNEIGEVNKRIQANPILLP